MSRAAAVMACAGRAVRARAHAAARHDRHMEGGETNLQGAGREGASCVDPWASEADMRAGATRRRGGNPHARREAPARPVSRPARAGAQRRLGIVDHGIAVGEAQDPERQAEQVLHARPRRLGVFVERGVDEVQAFRVAADQVRAEHDARVALVEERVVRPLRTGSAERAQPAGKQLAVGVGVVGLLVGRRGVLGQPDLRAELPAVAPCGTLMAARSEQGRQGARQAGRAPRRPGAPGR